MKVLSNLAVCLNLTKFDPVKHYGFDALFIYGYFLQWRFPQ